MRITNRGRMLSSLVSCSGRVRLTQIIAGNVISTLANQILIHCINPLLHLLYREAAIIVNDNNGTAAGLKQGTVEIGRGVGHGLSPVLTLKFYHGGGNRCGFPGPDHPVTISSIPCSAASPRVTPPHTSGRMLDL